LKVAPPSKILTAEITEKEPASIEAEITFASKHLEISPVLLNAKESLTIKVLVCDYCDKLQIDERIVGVKEIRQASAK